MLSKPSAPLRLHHLPLLMDVIRRIRLLNVISTVVTDDPRSKVTTGDCLAVMLCAIYSGAHDLYGVRERLSRYDMATIMQDPEFSIDEFPEERLAKAIDDIWKAGPEKLMFAIASQVIAAFCKRRSKIRPRNRALSAGCGGAKSGQWLFARS